MKCRIRINALPNLAGVSSDETTRSFTLLRSPLVALKDWWWVSRSFGFRTPPSSIVHCATTPSGATSQPGNSTAASLGSGSCHPLDTSSLSMMASLALWPRADL